MPAGRTRVPTNQRAFEDGVHPKRPTWPLEPVKRPGRALAVALKAEPDPAAPPTVVATGKGAVAEQILALAFAHGIKVREDADLAEVLAQLDLDSPIPVEVLTTVAEILVYVYRANGAVLPTLEVPT